MRYLGRYQLGATVPVYLPVETGPHVISKPDNPPQMKVLTNNGNDTISFTGSGNATFAYNGSNGTAFAYTLGTSTAASLQTNLAAITGLTGANAVVVSGSNGGPYTVSFGSTAASPGGTGLTFASADSTGGVISQTNTVVETHLMPNIDRYVITTSASTQPNLFRYTLFLGNKYSLGLYQIIFNYTISNTAYVDTAAFEVIGGGNSIGAVDSSYFFQLPSASHVIMGTESGEILQGRNPTA